MTKKRELLTAVGLVAVSACFIVGFYWAFTRDPRPTCFVYGLQMYMLGPLVGLVAGFIGGIVLALVRASVSTFLLFVVALATIAALGYVVGWVGYYCADGDDASAVLVVAFVVFAIAFAAAGFGATLGSLVGDLIVRLRGRSGPGGPDDDASATPGGQSTGPREDVDSRVGDP